VIDGESGILVDPEEFLSLADALIQAAAEYHVRA
jgi:hypothetical protein